VSENSQEHKNRSISETSENDKSDSSNNSFKYIVLIKNITSELKNPLAFQTLIQRKLPNAHLIAYPAMKINGLRLIFLNSQIKEEFLKTFQPSDFGQSSIVESFNEKLRRPQRPFYMRSQRCEH